MMKKELRQSNISLEPEPEKYNTEKTNEKLINSIKNLLPLLTEKNLRCTYQFILHITKR